jgi:hypothetical protein
MPQALNARSFRADALSRSALAIVSRCHAFVFLSSSRKPVNRPLVDECCVALSLCVRSFHNKMMTPTEKYLFDLHGFIVVRGVLSPEEVSSANGTENNLSLRWQAEIHTHFFFYGTLLMVLAVGDAVTRRWHHDGIWVVVDRYTLLDIGNLRAQMPRKYSFDTEMHRNSFDGWNYHT